MLKVKKGSIIKKKSQDQDERLEPQNDIKNSIKELFLKDQKRKNN